MHSQAQVIVLSNQGSIRADVDRVAVFDRHDSIAFLQGGQTVRHQYDGFLPVQLFDGTHEVRLRRVVQRACRLVQHQDVGLMIERTSDANALPLSAGELDATLAHDGVEPLRQASDEGRDLRGRKRVPDRLLVDDVVCEAKTYVATDGVVHEVDDLG